MLIWPADRKRIVVRERPGECGIEQNEKAKRFAELHLKGNPILLYNAWDAGSAKAILESGAKAIATSSWSVAEAQGYRDGEVIPITLVERIIARIASTIDAPVTIDFEGGYSEDESALAENVSRLVELGIVGINFEDRVVKGKGLYGVDRQARRIAAIRAAAEKRGIKLFINARTDVFFESGDAAKSIDDALDRAKAYQAAGASGFFVPGLQGAASIGRICERVTLPVNVMVMEGVPPNEQLSELGVARISYGPIPYIKAMEALKKEAELTYGSITRRTSMHSGGHFAALEAPQQLATEIKAFFRPMRALTRACASRPFVRAVSWTRLAARYISCYLQILKEHDELQRLSGRSLQDIGLRPQDVETIMRRPTWSRCWQWVRSCRRHQCRATIVCKGRCRPELSRPMS